MSHRFTALISTTILVAALAVPVGMSASATEEGTPSDPTAVESAPLESEQLESEPLESGSVPAAEPASRIIITAQEGAAGSGEPAESADVAASAATEIIDDTSQVDVSVDGAQALGGESVAIDLDQTLGTAELDTLVAELEANPAIAAAEPDRRAVASDVIPNDPYFSSQWQLNGTYGVKAPQAWDQTQGSASVKVAVLDTGRTDHPDLAGRWTTGYDFVSYEYSEGGIRYTDLGHDGNGWDSNPTDEGDWCPDDGSASSWHGTMVAGTIAALANNSIGGAGVAPKVKIAPVRVLGECGGLFSDIAAGIRWAAGGKVASNVPTTPAADVINLSLGGYAVGQPCPVFLQSAINFANAQGSLVVVAAGNEGGSLANATPANCSGVVSVGATTQNGTRASFSNVGVPSNPLTIAAPGTNFILPSGASASGRERTGYCYTGKTSCGRSGTGTVSGTSFAAPTVSAVAALYLSKNPTHTAKTVTRMLKATATPFPTSCGTPCNPIKLGAGIVNASAMLSTTPGLAPTTPVITGSVVTGKTLKAKITSWGSGTSYSYRWYSNGVALSGGTKSTYKVKSSDRGKRLQVVVRGSKPSYGKSVAVSRESSKVLGTLKASTPKITGTKKVGRKIKAKVVKSWGNSVKYSYTWYRNGKKIGNATKSVYTLKARDKGKRMTVKVTGKKSGYVSVSKTSKRTAKIRR